MNPPPWAPQILRPGNRSSVPSKMRCESAMVVSSGLPITLVEKAVTLQPAAQLRYCLRMDEDERLKRLGRLPERVQARRRQLLLIDNGAERDATHAMDLERLGELFGGQLRMLRRDGGERDGSIGTGRAQGGKPAVLRVDDSRRRLRNRRRTTTG